MIYTLQMTIIYSSLGSSNSSWSSSSIASVRVIFTPGRLVTIGLVDSSLDEVIGSAFSMAASWSTSDFSTPSLLSSSSTGGTTTSLIVKPFTTFGSFGSGSTFSILNDLGFFGHNWFNFSITHFGNFQ